MSKKPSPSRWKRSRGQIGKPVPAVAFDERRIAWLFGTELGRFELVEKPR